MLLIKPIVKTIINKNKTYFGALEVIEKILLGSKDLNIFKLYIKKILFNFYYERCSDQECRGRIMIEVTYFTLLIRIYLNITKSMSKICTNCVKKMN